MSRFNPAGLFLASSWLLAIPAAAADFPVPAISAQPAHCTCYRAEEPPLIDGRLDDACWAAAPWTANFMDIKGPFRPAPRFRTRAKMSWDDDYFYVAAEMEEPHVWATLTERDAVIYHDNDFEVFIDPDGDNHAYYELEINALGTEWDLLLLKPYRDGGPAVNAWDIRGLKTAVHIDGTLNDPTDTDVGWSVEIAFPWAVLQECANRPMPPEDVSRMRVNFSRVQWRTRVTDGRYEKETDPQTGEPLAEDNWVWSPQGLIAMHYPERWGYVHFSKRTSSGVLPEPTYHALDWDVLSQLMQIYYRQKQWHADHGEFATDPTLLGLDDPWLLQNFTLHVSPSLFEATLRGGGFTAHVTQDGRLWTTSDWPE